MEECTYSDTAKKKGIDNTPGATHKAHIVESIETLIDPLREAWEQHCRAHGLGSPGIRISSRLPWSGAEQSSGRFCHFGTLPRLCRRPRTYKWQDDGVQTLLP